MTGPEDAGLRILLVEDEAANRALVRAIIERAGDELGSVALDVVATIADARAVLAAELVDVVLVDVRLPDGSGLDLATELRARPDPPQIGVLSASVLPAEQATALAAGADAFLGKPFGAADLIHLVRHLAHPDES